MTDGGKGSAPRPLSVEPDEYQRRWEMTFGRKEPQACPDCGKRSQAGDVHTCTPERQED